MFRNLEAEQARNNLTNEKVANMLGISRKCYENRKNKGTFRLLEVLRLCEIFRCDIKYLFEIEDEQKKDYAKIH